MSSRIFFVEYSWLPGRYANKISLWDIRPLQRPTVPRFPKAWCPWWWWRGKKINCFVEKVSYVISTFLKCDDKCWIYNFNNSLLLYLTFHNGPLIIIVLSDRFKNEYKNIILFTLVKQLFIQVSGICVCLYFK